MHTPIAHVVGSFDLPDPTIEVPFEKFAHLKDSDDMLNRAAFWAMLCAWELDKQGKSAPASLAIEARNDGHTFNRLASELHIRDSVLITKHDLDWLRRGHRHGDRVLFTQLALGWVVSVLLVAWLGYVLW